MSISVTCMCGKVFEVPTELAGKQGKCQCGRTVLIPKLTPFQAAEIELAEQREKHEGQAPPRSLQGPLAQITAAIQRVDPPRVSNPSATSGPGRPDTSPPQNIRGLLLLPLAGLLILPLIAFLSCYSDIQLIGDLNQRGFSIYESHATVQYVFAIVDFAGMTIVFLASMFVAFRLLEKGPQTPKLFVAYGLGVVSFALIRFGVLCCGLVFETVRSNYEVYDLRRGSLAGLLIASDILPVIAWFALWILYFHVSKRVKRTFAAESVLPAGGAPGFFADMRRSAVLITLCIAVSVAVAIACIVHIPTWYLGAWALEGPIESGSTVLPSNLVFSTEGVTFRWGAGQYYYYRVTGTRKAGAQITIYGETDVAPPGREGITFAMFIVEQEGDSLLLINTWGVKNWPPKYRRAAAND